MKNVFFYHRSCIGMGILLLMWCGNVFVSTPIRPAAL